MPSHRRHLVAGVVGVVLGLGSAGCGRLADGGDGTEETLGVLTASVTQADPVHPEPIPPGIALALFWRPASQHDALFEGGAPRAPWICTEITPYRPPVCDVTAASGAERCVRQRGPGDLDPVQLLDYQLGALGFVFPLHELPPAAALYDLSRHGGRGTFALAALRAFVDEDGDGELRYATSTVAPERVVADSAYADDAEPGDLRRSYLLAYLSPGAQVPLAAVKPRVAAVLGALPHGFSLWIKERWVDPYRRVFTFERIASLEGERIELYAGRDLSLARKWCAGDVELRTHVSDLPVGYAPLSCSERGDVATWRMSWPLPERCTFEVLLYEACTAAAPSWACPAVEGLVDVTVRASGAELPEAFSLAVDGVGTTSVGLTDDARFGVRAGTHVVTLSAVPANCTVAPASSVVMTVADRQIAEVAFEVTCVRTPRLRVTTMTTGEGIDDAYVVSVAGVSVPIYANDSALLVFSPQVDGWFAVHLDDVAPNCVAEDVMVHLLPGAVPEVVIPVTCSVPRTLGKLRVTRVTTGASPGGHHYRLEWGPPDAPDAWRSVPVNAGDIATFEEVPAGTYQARLRELAPNCVPPPVATFQIVAGETTDVRFEIVCAPPTRIAYAGRASFDDLSATFSASEIWVVDSNGEGLTNLTQHPADDEDPAWSPDGSRLAFTSDRDGNREIYVMNGDGTSPTRLTNHAAYDGQPSWSPDGARIAFVSDRDGVSSIYVMNADGTGLVRLTSDPLGDSKPAWSPDGGRIAFSRAVLEATEMYGSRVHLIAPDGSGDARLTPEEDWPYWWWLHELDPSWSPDGSTIAFTRNTDWENDVYLAPADGGSPPAWAGFSGEDPSWAPDGVHVAYTFRCPQIWDGCAPWATIYAAGPGGSFVVVADGASQSQPAWRPLAPVSP